MLCPSKSYWSRGLLTGFDITSFPLVFNFLYKLINIYFFLFLYRTTRSDSRWDLYQIAMIGLYFIQAHSKNIVNEFSNSLTGEGDLSSVSKYMIYMYAHLYIGTNVRIVIGILDTTYPKETILFLIIIQQISGILQ